MSLANKKVIIDNTPVPKDGAFSDYSISTMTTVRTDYNMKYNIKTLTIYSGLACLVLFTIILGQCYLICKLRKDTNDKRAKLKTDFGDEFSLNKDKSS